MEVQFKLAARSMLHGSACASHARGSTFRPVAVCRKGLLGYEQAAHFSLENGVLEWKMAQSGASGGAAPGRGA